MSCTESVIWAMQWSSAAVRASSCLRQLPWKLSWSSIRSTDDVLVTTHHERRKSATAECLGPRLTYNDFSHRYKYINLHNVTLIKNIIEEKYLYVRHLIRRVTLFLSSSSGPVTHTGSRFPGSGRQAEGSARGETGATSVESSLEVTRFLFFFIRL